VEGAQGHVKISVPQDAVAAFCRRNGVREFALFGSILRDDFTQNSDIDILVDFLPDTKVTFFRLADMENELRTIFQREIDLVLKDTLHRRIAAEVLASRAEGVKPFRTVVSTSLVKFKECRRAG
jgi:hypothetical protein